VSDGFRFIVVADSHIRPPDQEVDAYPSNALMVQRNKYIVDLCNRIDVAFVVHLGDIVHPLPTEETHGVAIDLAKGVYAELRHPIHFVAGNHDVGDKPNAFVAVPAVAEENYHAFEEAWGPSYYSFDVGDCHFVAIDTQVLNSELEREHIQRAWLESDLDVAAASGKRIFLFTHYPPFVRDRHENEHYDNVGEPARSWFLDLLESCDVEAVFSGHVHNFLYNRHGRTDLYVAPSTAFVRPDYSELASIAPLAENGRDDPPKLGVIVVDVTAGDHISRPVRSFGATFPAKTLPMAVEAALEPDWESPVGVTLRHGWTSVTEFPTAGLDEFNRKQIRNDALILALWEARINDLRIPLTDVCTTAGRNRVEALTARGMRFSVFSAGVPNPNSFTTVRSISGFVDRWEIIVRPDRFADVLASVAGGRTEDVNLAIAPIVPIGPPDATAHHFVSAGFRIDNDPHLAALLELDASRAFGNLVFHVPWGNDVADGVTRSNAIAREYGRRAVVIIDLPANSESSTFDDDEAVASHAVTAARVATSATDAAVFLDAFVDHDRGYYTRHGLIDRAFNPRPALYWLIEESAADPGL